MLAFYYSENTGKNLLSPLSCFVNCDEILGSNSPSGHVATIIFGATSKWGKRSTCNCLVLNSHLGTLLFICSSCSRENGNLQRICSSLRTAQISMIDSIIKIKPSRSHGLRISLGIVLRIKTKQCSRYIDYQISTIQRLLYFFSLPQPTLNLPASLAMDFQENPWSFPGPTNTNDCIPDSWSLGSLRWAPGWWSKAIS